MTLNVKIITGPKYEWITGGQDQGSAPILYPIPDTRLFGRFAGYYPTPDTRLFRVVG